MSFDLNDAELQRTGDLIPDGTVAKLAMLLRPGGVDGAAELDRGLLKRSATPGSDVLMLDCEITVVEGPYARRKLWQQLTISGGKLDENGVSIGGRISNTTLRAMIDSAHGLDPHDVSEEAKSKRVLRGYTQLSGIIFVGKIKVEISNNPAYPNRNKLDRVVVPTEPEWRKVMDGENVPACPSSRPRTQISGAVSSAWASPQPARETPSASGASPSGSASNTPTPASTDGPAWLNG